MLEKLEMFIALANARHFGRAAKGLGISQPALSYSIRQLETQLGATLVARGSRFDGLTAEGEVALVRARQIVDEARALKRELRAMPAADA